MRGVQLERVVQVVGVCVCVCAHSVSAHLDKGPLDKALDWRCGGRFYRSEVSFIAGMHFVCVFVFVCLCVCVCVLSLIHISEPTRPP